MIIAAHRRFDAEIEALVVRLDMEVVPTTIETARQCAQAHLRWGKGVHPAKLNYGDTFAYALAKSRNCPLLFIGNDFSRTDIVSAI